jgi:GcrA cell cycle regulator
LHLPCSAFVKFIVPDAFACAGQGIFLSEIPGGNMSFDGTKWSDDRTELARKLWREGLSANQIAARLGGVTRNAVIGKLDRIGESGRVTPSRNFGIKRAKTPRSRKVKPPQMATVRSVLTGFSPLRMVKAPEPLQEYEELFIPLEDRKGVLDLKGTDCRWPIGDPQHADFHFCGHPQARGISYCAHHAQRAYQAPKTAHYIPNTYFKPGPPKEGPEAILEILRTKAA